MPSSFDTLSDECLQEEREPSVTFREEAELYLRSSTPGPTGDAGRLDSAPVFLKYMFRYDVILVFVCKSDLLSHKF